MYCKFLFVLLIIYNVQTQNVNKQLEVEVLYESLCPDSLAFITQQLYPAWKEFGPYINVKFVPFGKSDSSNDGKIRFKCQHGPRECEGNKLQSCALKDLQDQNLQVHFVNCFMKTFRHEASNNGDSAISNPDVILSKTLSWLLRHGAVKEGLHLTSEGFIRVDEILQHKSLRGKYTVADVERVVSSNDKQRFALRKSATGALEVRANQGHSLPSVGLDLVPITEGIGDVIHGTFFKWLPDIKREGLSRMRRNHIHFATGLPTDATVVSGARSSAQVFIYIDLEKALTDGIKFYKSSNGVILSPGNSRGYLEPKYFKKICTKNGDFL